MLKINRYFCLTNNPFSWLILLILLFLTGCGESKFSQCQKITEITLKINKDTRGYSKNKNPEEVLPVVNVFGESAKEIASLKIEDQKIKDYQKDLTKIYEGYGEATNDFIEAINNRDVDTALSSKFKVEQVNKKEKEIVQQINEYCRNK